MLSTIHQRKPWVRSETRQIRPFRYESNYLRDAELRLYDDAEFTADDVIHTDDVDLQRLAPAVRVSMPPIDFEDVVGVPSDQLRFIVLLEDRFLKRSSILCNLRMDEIPNGLIELGPDVRKSASWLGDTRIHLAVMLTQDRQALPGFAKRAGNWVARKSFRITKPIDTAIFPIEPVNDDWFVKQELPANTAYFVQILDDDLDQPSAELSNLVKVYASESLVAALASDGGSPVVRALITAIYTEIVTTVLLTGFARLQEDAPSPDSILELVVDRISKATAVPRERLIKMARQGGGSRLRAVVQAEAELSRAMISAARRRVS